MAIFNESTLAAINLILQGYLLPDADMTIKLNNILSMNLAFHDGTGGLKTIHDLTRQPYVPTKKLGFFDKIGKTGKQISGVIADQLTDIAADKINPFNEEDELGRAMGTLFSLGVSSAGNTLASNFVKNVGLTQGLGKNVLESIGGAGAGIAANYIGQGINSLGGDSRLSRAIGQGIATGLGSVGGLAISNLSKGVGAFKGIKDSISAIKDFSLASKSLKSAIAAANAGKMGTEGLKNAKNVYDMTKGLSTAAKWNLAGLGGQVLGSAIGAATGPSKEYAGKYGGITSTMDTVYDLASTGISMLGPVGTGVSGIMALNKGLSNIFGSTDGMTTQDAILGSAFMPAPVKWLNMWGANTTGTFNNLSWLNSEKATSFMGNAFGNLQNKFDKAREEAGKTYGTFSRGAYKEAQKNIDFANTAWDKILNMADLNIYQNIRALDMSSINNLRYAQDIQGGWNPIYRGKQGMKIFNNATNHNIGMRLLSAAALIDNKQMILSAQGGTKVIRPPRMRAHRKGDESRGLTPEEQEWWKLYEEEQKRLLEEDTARKQKQREEAADKFNQQASTVMGAMTLQANETPFTGQEYQQAAENLRQEKVEKFHEKAEELGKGFEAAMMADLAVSAVPLFRWTFNKAGLLVKVPLEKTNLFLTSPYTGKWTQFGNREYRLKPGYVGMNGVPVESRTLKITPENATNMTPEQWTAAQDAAIAKGDMAEAQRLSDLHSDIAAKKEGFTVYNTYRSQKPNDKYKWENKSPYDDSRYGIGKSSGYFTTDSEPVARTYKYTDDSPLFNLNIYMKNPYIKDIEGRSWQFADTRIAPNGAKYGVTTDEIINKVKPEGVYDGVIFKNIVDVGAFRRNLNGASDVATDYVSFPGRAKLRDAVTYDPVTGKRIPLGERHNFNINDIRYSWLPWFLGGSTAVTLYNNSK